MARSTYMIVIILNMISLAIVTNAVTMDNSITGAPSIECTTQAINVKVNTEKPFFGRLFVKGMSRTSHCVQDFSKSANGVTSIQMIIPLGSCDMQRERKLNPAGMQQTITIIVSFHALFITKIDRAYNLRCFFMSSGEKVITQGYQVSMITTQELHAASAMPSCEYTVRRGSLTGDLVQYAVVGEKLYHVWKCLGTNTFGILVRNCVVQDSTRTQFVAIDTQGCTTDRNVVNDLTYGVNLDEAFVEVHAFKFADDVNVYFKCEITFCRKTATSHDEAMGETTCRGVTPPICNARSAAVSQGPTLTITSAIPSYSSTSGQSPSFEPLLASTPQTAYNGLPVSQRSSSIPPYRSPYHRRQRSKRNVTIDSIEDVNQKFVSFNQMKTVKNTMRVIDVVPKNNFIILDPIDTTSSKYSDKFQFSSDFSGSSDSSPPVTVNSDIGNVKLLNRMPSSDPSNQAQKQNWNEQWAFITVGFAITASLVVIGFVLVSFLAFLLCRRSSVDQAPPCNHYAMSPHSSLQRMLPRY